jgi:hypothetical protein
MIDNLHWRYLFSHLGKSSVPPAPCKEDILEADKGNRIRTFNYMAKGIA